MKNYQNILPQLGARCLLLLTVLMFTHVTLMAQDEEAAPPKKAKARIGLTYSNYNNIGTRLTASVKIKEDRSYVNVPDVKVDFYIDSISEASHLGYTMTDEAGQAVFITPETLRKRTLKEHEFHYFATIEGDERVKAGEQDLVVKGSMMEMNLKEEDSVRKVHVFVGAHDSTGEIAPLEGIEVKVYVKRLFGLLPITEGFETTDEEGLMTLDFPGDLPGDEAGELMILARVEDHEDYGTLVAAKKIAWGIPLVTDPDEMKGELWSARKNAPLSLIFIVNTLLIGIWGIIVYIFFQILKIRSLGKAK